MAERLRSVTRDSDTVARLGGDEFVILAIGARRITATRIAQRVRAAFERPIAVSGSPIRTTVSIGIAEAEPEDVAVDLLEQARTAMAHARDAGQTDL